MKALGVITARGGSKGIPGKNIRMLGGKPLLQYTIEAGQAARRLAHLLLSTDDEAIAAVGRACGVAVPFLRPPALARDDTPTLPVLQHAVRWFEAQGGRCDAVCLLQPTVPFRLARDIDACLELLERHDADAVVSVLPVPDKYNPHWTFEMQPEGWLALATGEPEPVPRRQDLPAAYHRDGSVYVTRRDVLMEQGSLYGRRLLGYPVQRTVNLDTPDDWLRAEQLVAAALEGGAVAASQLGR